MSVTNLGGQVITFDYKEPATGKDFNKIYNNVIKTGIYKGGAITYKATNAITIAPFVAIVQDAVAADKIITVKTTTIIDFLVAEITPILYFTFTWSDTENNWLDFGLRSLASSAVTGEITLGTILFSGGNVNPVTPVLYTNRTYGLTDTSGNINLENLLYIGSNHDVTIGRSGASSAQLTGNFTITGNESVTGNHAVTGNQTITGSQIITSTQTVNGEQTVNNNSIITGNQTVNSSVKTNSISSRTGSDVTLTGNEIITGKLTIQQATGTAPLIITSTTVNTNLNADLHDGYHAGNSTSQIPVSNGTVNTNLNSDLHDGYHAGNSSGQTPVSNGNVNINLNSDLLDGYHASNSTSSIPISNGAVNTNLNADLHDGYHAGNSTSQIPVSNGNVNTNLNSDLLDSAHLSTDVLLTSNVDTLIPSQAAVRSIITYGWIPSAHSWTYSASIPTEYTYVIWAYGDLSSIYKAGTRIKLTHAAQTKYFLVLDCYLTGGTSQLHLYGGNTYTLDASEMSNIQFSNIKSPSGFNHSIFSYYYDTSTDASTPFSVGSSSWVKLTGFTLPIGLWDISVHYCVILNGFTYFTLIPGDGITINTETHPQSTIFHSSTSGLEVTLWNKLVYNNPRTTNYNIYLWAKSYSGTVSVDLAGYYDLNNKLLATSLLI